MSGDEPADVEGGAREDRQGGGEQPLVIRKRGRRVTTQPPAGYAGEPPIERQQSNENDARLRGDVPPHWG